MIVTPGPQSIFATRPPPLVAFDDFSVILVVFLSPQQSRTFSHNLILRGEVMSMQ